MMKRSGKDVDILVVGAGAVGLAAGIALAHAGWRTTVVGRTGVRPDGRTVALMEGSLGFLRGIGVWERLEPLSAPLQTLAIIDDTGGLFRAPPVSFHASEIGLDAFGRNIESAALVQGLAAQAAEMPGLTLRDDPLVALDVSGDLARVTLASGTVIATPLVAGADGRNSPVREAAGIGAREWRYEQEAITAIFEHDRPHRDTSTEFHTRKGPFTLVPLPGRRSSLVWLTDPARADALRAMDDTAFARAVETQAQSMLGAMRLAGPRGVVPMGGLSVERFTAERVALLGEAAHVFPPIGAQGLNLGLRDVASLVDAVGALPGDPGSAALLARYEQARGFDVRSRTGAVDALNRSLLADFLPADMLRGMGLMALAGIRPLRRFVMRQGLGAAR